MEPSGEFLVLHFHIPRHPLSRMKYDCCCSRLPSHCTRTFNLKCICCRHTFHFLLRLSNIINHREICILCFRSSSQVITAGETAPRALKDLRNRCLNPGKYAQHLEKWLAYYSPQQLHIIDGEQLKGDPVDVMNDLQRFLKISPQFDYAQNLRFDEKKGFFCQVVPGEGRTKCLGKSKGRQYPAMDDRSQKILQR